MKSLPTYDFIETGRLASEWCGATARAYWSSPAFGIAANPYPGIFAAWGTVAERSFSRMVEKPDWGIETVISAGEEYLVNVECVIAKPFCDLIQFRVRRRKPSARKVLLIAPMSGHYATLLRRTVASLLPTCDVYVTDWKNARDIPVSQGKFDIEDFCRYLIEFILHLGSDTNVIAVCQPAPLALAAVAKIAEEQHDKQPRTMTLIGGPIDPDAAPTEVTDFGKRYTMGQLEHLVVQHVGASHAGVGRLVYPGVLQLASFIAMNLPSHFDAFFNQIMRVSKGEAADHDRHNAFYDEYLAVMDMTAEFYLSTVKRIFKAREIAENRFKVGGCRIDIGKISRTAVKIVEGGRDDISAPGQCAAALPLLSGLPENLKAYHLEPEAGHYGIFAGKSWYRNIRPLVLDFIDGNSSAH